VTLPTYYEWAFDSVGRQESIEAFPLHKPLIKDVIVIDALLGINEGSVRKITG
jgi:hypothetical protein